MSANEHQPSCIKYFWMFYYMCDLTFFSVAYMVCLMEWEVCTSLKGWGNIAQQGFEFQLTQGLVQFL